MRLKHNKKRNTAFVYEALVRELTESVVKNNKNKQNKIVSIIKDHFSNGSLLKEELDLYRSIYETRHIEKRIAEKIVVEVKEKHEDINKKDLFIEQSSLISKINKTLSSKIYSNFVPNYKTIASVYSIFQDGLPVRDRVLLEENIVNEMSSSVVTKQETQQPIDSLVYSSFVNNFNQEYSSTLSESQKKLLSNYITSFEDNGIDWKVFLNEEIHRLKDSLNTLKNNDTIKNDNILNQKLDQVFTVLEETAKTHVDSKTVELVLNVQKLVEEMEEDVSWYTNRNGPDSLSKS